MAIYTWPDWLRHQAATLVIEHAQAATVGIYGAGDQVVTHPGSRWGWDLDFGTQTRRERLRTEAFFTKLTGMQHRLRLSDFQADTPDGTIRMQGVTIRTAVAQFATVLPLAGCGVTTTLLEGDWLEAFAQLFRVVANATADINGLMDVEVRHMAVRAIPAGTPVVLDRPSGLFGLAERNLALPRSSGDAQPPFSLRIVERPPA